MAGYQNWGGMQNLLDTDFAKFTETFRDTTAAISNKKFPINNVSFRNKFGVMQSEEGWLNFEYEVWWRMHSNEPRCYAGVHMLSPTPTCDFLCAGSECLLKGPAVPNKDNRRMLVAADGRPEVTPAMPADFEKRFL